MNIAAFFRKYPFIIREWSVKMGMNRQWLEQLGRKPLTPHYKRINQDFINDFKNNIAQQLKHVTVTPDNMKQVIDSIRPMYGISTAAVAANLGKTRYWIRYAANTAADTRICNQNCANIQSYLHRLAAEISQVKITL